MDELKTLRELAEKARALDGEWYSADKLQGAMPDGVATPDAAFMAALSPAVILSILDKLEKAEADAKRYRWLRGCYGWLPSAGFEDCWRDGDDEKIDAAIDAQLDKQEKQ